MRRGKKCQFHTDDSTDSGRVEQEIISVWYAKGIVETTFVALKSPASPNGIGIYYAIKSGLLLVKSYEVALKRKMVAMGCDSASMMVANTLEVHQYF